MHRFISSAALLFILFFAAHAHAEDQARVEVFSPEGLVKKVRQVAVRFSEQMVSFGDPRTEPPFNISCSEKGQGRWADSSNWVYDFERDLPGGVNCRFSLKDGIRSVSGRPLGGSRDFSFSTGGPAVIRSYPAAGSEAISEDQIFIAELDVAADEQSVLSNAWCEIEGINERVGLNIIKGDERDRILSQYRFLKNSPSLLLQCRQRFPHKAVVRLVWGRGIATSEGVRAADEQVLNFRVRPAFTIAFSCSRENPKADCIPILPMRLDFSSPVSWDMAKKIVIKSGSRKYRPEKSSRGEEEEDPTAEGPAVADENFVYGVSFRGPFPEESSFVVEIPHEIKDDAGRQASNRARFPLAVRTASNPPLAKFASRFGIIELNGEAALPVTIRNIESRISARQLRVGSDEQVINWLFRISRAKRETSLLGQEKDARAFPVPKSSGGKAFEVIGIPLKDPGLYVVEMESRILGSSLLGKNSPMFVPAAALVTNLSAHFKWGRESSLVWVTTLDKAEPAKDVSVSIRDCKGVLYWSGKTDAQGLARIQKQLPSEKDLQYCNAEINHAEASQSLRGINRGLFVFARSGQDMTFVHTSWEEGIEPWRFNLPEEDENAAVTAHTIMDRSLLRAGETLHMKHLFRKNRLSGFGLASSSEMPKAVLITHAGSEQRYEMPLKWDRKGAAESRWIIPKEAALGMYTITLLKKGQAGTSKQKNQQEYYPEGWVSGSFRVEEFRVPLMKALLQQTAAPLINASEAEVDIQVSYLSGGGAKNAAVKLRSQIHPKYIHFPDYEDYTFANGEVKEGRTRRASDEEPAGPVRGPQPKILASDLTLDEKGSLRTKISGLPAVSQPQDIQTEIEFRDPNGEVQTVSRKIPLWTSGILMGIKPDSWAASKEDFKFTVVALDLAGSPVSGKKVKVDLFRRNAYSHRKRLVGGFYAYEHTSEIKRIGQICEGTTDSRGLLICSAKAAATGNVIIQAEASDDAGNPSRTHRDVWIAGKGDWWFDVSDHDRMDLIPEKKKYEPGETAKFQVRMPFREATALISIERGGIIETLVKRLSAKHPVIEIPIRKSYAPNVFVSALVVRGRVSGVQPTALVDLGKPAFKLGVAEIRVGWRAYELKVKVTSDQRQYKVREKAKIKVSVRRYDGTLPPKDSEVAIAAVDEGLLELMPNKSWALLQGMMARRGYGVYTSSAQMQVVGKRHYGLKAQPQGGGGGHQTARELFDTLLFWKAKVKLDEKGEASLDIPLNDSLTSFRIVAVATGGKDLFGTGETSLRSTQDLMLLSGLPPVVREGDRFHAGFTIRNTSDRKMDIELKAVINGAQLGIPEGETIQLNPGEADEAGWKVTVPYGTKELASEVTASEKGGTTTDTLRIKQRVSEAVPVRTLQATLARVEKSYHLDIERPSDALKGKGGITVSLRSSLAESLGGVAAYMRSYPYSCMEQKVSRAVSLKDQALWNSLIAELPGHMDSDGLVKYFPAMSYGNEALTAYMLSIAHEAGWKIPEGLQARMEEGLKGFVAGKIARYSFISAADLSVRKIAAIAALARVGAADAKLLGSLRIEPNLWPTSALIDLIDAARLMKDMPQRQMRLSETAQMLRARMNFQGTALGFSTEQADHLWWLMVSPDLNAVRSIISLIDFEDWKPDIPRLVRSAIGRQRKGAWDLTTANAWGVLAIGRFSEKFEAEAVTGITTASLGESSRTENWRPAAPEKHQKAELKFSWPNRKERLSLTHDGTGRPWAVIQSSAAIRLKEPLSAGFKIKKTVAPVEQKAAGQWSRGDVMRVRLEVEADADMTWVVLNDPIPAGSMILGTGLARDSGIMRTGEKRSGDVWPVYEERSFETYRAYYEFVPKGSWSTEYTLRLNNSGMFNMPVTRVEAMYFPEAFGEIPNKTMEVGQ